MTKSERSEDRSIAALLAPDIIVLLDDSPTDVAAETEEMHPADLADVAEEMPRDRVAEFLLALPSERAADVLEYLDTELRTELLEEMTAKQAATIVAQMTPDDRADTLEALEKGVVDDILAEIPIEARRETERLLRFDPETAAGMMTTEFVSAPEDMTVEEALERVRAAARSGRREAMYAVYTTDVQGRLMGVLSLRELLAAAPGTRLAEAAWTDVLRVRPSADRDEVARLTANYDLVAVPVVSESGHVMGVVTVDDVIDAIQEEQTEDVHKLGGMEALDESYMQVGIGAMVKKRAGWLAILFVGGLLTATAIDHFQSELARAMLLLAFIPLIISSGGNSGSQATSLIIRAMALNEISLSDWWRVAMRELGSGMLLGAILGLLGVIRVVGWQLLGWSDYGEYYWRVGITIGAALLGVVTFGSFVGSMLPFLLRRLGLDPASASAPFVATLVDVTGLLIYFSVAIAVLRGTLL